MASNMGLAATAMVAAAAVGCCGAVSVQASAHPSNSASTPTPSSFPLTDSINEMLSTASHVLARIPGSAIFLRYVRSSYQDDPIRSLLELFLLVFAIRTVLQSRTRGGSSGSNFVKLSEKEIDDLVDEFHPDPLCAPLTPSESHDLLSVPTIIGAPSAHPKISVPTLNHGKAREVINLASYDFMDLAGSEKVKDKAVTALRKYGVGSCSPPGFYGTIDVHMALEADIARFLGVDKCIIYSQGFSTISSVIPAFSKRGDIIVADRGVNFAIQKGLQISRSTVKWFDHNNMASLEAALQSVVRDDKRRKGPLTRRFIVTEGIFEGDGAKTDLAKIVELKRKYKFRLFLDESMSFGTVGATGRGMTELCEVPPSEVDMIVGSMANTLGSSGGFCAGTEEVVFHQRINGMSFVYSAAMPAMLAVASSTAIQHLISTPSIMSTLQDNVRILRNVLDHVESVWIPSDPISPLIHIQIRSKLERHPDTPIEKFEKGRHVLGVGDVSVNLAEGQPQKLPAVVTTSSADANPNPPSPALSSSSAATVKANGSGSSSSKKRGSGGAGSSAYAPSNAFQPHDLSVAEQTRLLQAIVDDALEHGVFIVRAKRLPSINPKVLESGPESRPSIRIAVNAGHNKKEVEKAANVLKASIVRLIGKRR